MKSARTWLISSIVFGLAGVMLFFAAFATAISGGESSEFSRSFLALLLVTCAALWAVSLLAGTVLLFRQSRKGALEIAIVVLSFALIAYLFGPNLLSRLGLG
jgi:hypothetical protein